MTKSKCLSLRMFFHPFGTYYILRSVLSLPKSWESCSTQQENRVIDFLVYLGSLPEGRSLELAKTFSKKKHIKSTGFSSFLILGVIYFSSILFLNLKKDHLSVEQVVILPNLSTIIRNLEMF